jgi:hypothetical protein
MRKVLDQYTPLRPSLPDRRDFQSPTMPTRIPRRWENALSVTGVGHAKNMLARRVALLGCFTT